MKREIKFRGKSIYGNIWVYGNLIHSKRFSGCSNEYRIHDIDTGLEHDVIPETVGQFIGLTDKNKKEVFVGDIDSSGLFVKYNKLHCCYGLFSESGYKKDIVADCCDKNGKAPKTWTCSAIEIIGNIHETEQK